MLKQTGISLLFGALVLTAVLKFVFLPPGTGDSTAATLQWNAAVASANNPLVSQAGNSAQLQVSKLGAGFANLHVTPFAADNYAFIHLALEQSNPKAEVRLLWNTSESSDGHRSYILESHSRNPIWLATQELAGWEGEISSLHLLVSGNEGDTLSINEASLHTPSLQYQLRAIYSDFTAFVPWNRAAVNRHTGATTASSFYPVPLIVSWLAFSVGGYLLLTLARASVQFEWRTVGLLFLSCWIVLDLSWQNQLIQQLADTYKTFAGKTNREKLAVGPDAQLYQFITAVQAQLEPGNPRIFVTSDDDYTGLKGAYYLYPQNVFWSLKNPEIPPSHYLRSGDYLVLLKPSTAIIDNEKGTLLAGTHEITIEQILMGGPGQLVRVN